MKRRVGFIGGAGAALAAAAATPQLLDASGTPIPPKDDIPFIQWLPDGNAIGHLLSVNGNIYELALQFLKTGGRYSFVLRADNMAELVAGFPVKGGDKGEMVIVAEEVVPNGPEIGPAVDRLVAASVANLHKLPITETIQ